MNKLEKTTPKSQIIAAALFVFSILCIIDTIIISSRSGGKDLGIILPAFAGIFIFLIIIFTKTSLYKNNTKLYIKIGKILLVLFSVWLVSFIIVCSIIISSAHSDSLQKTDCVIVLGAGLKEETPTLVLKERLNYAIDYLMVNPTSKVIVSGGQGPGETITEADAMKKYLVDRGISKDIIIKEEQSTSTYENMISSKRLYEKEFGQRLNKVIIITSDFHIFRSKLLAKRAGLVPYGISSATPWYLYPNVFLREYFALFKSLIIDR